MKKKGQNHLRFGKISGDFENSSRSCPDLSKYDMVVVFLFVTIGTGE
jgi:hypothetical protein